MKTKTPHNIHMQFIHMCEAIYINASPSISRDDYPHRSLSYSTTLLFLKHIAVAEELTRNWKQVDKDIHDKKITPATLLAHACYSKTYIHTLMHSQIQKHMRLATDILEMMPTAITHQS